MKNLSEELILVFKQHAEAHVEKHRMNVEVYLQNPVGIGEHSDIMEAIETEIKAMAEYEDMIDIANKYF